MAERIGGLSEDQIIGVQKSCYLLRKYAIQYSDWRPLCDGQCIREQATDNPASCPQGIEGSGYVQVVPQGEVPGGELHVFDASSATVLPPREGVKVADAKIMGANSDGGEIYVGDFFGITIRNTSG